MSPVPNTNWRRLKYTIQTDKGAAVVDGICNADATLGVHFNGGQTCDVTHIVSGLRVAAFRELGHAVAFVDRVTPLTDWTALHPVVPAYAHIARIREEVTQ